jgi:GntR family transcriptional regulator, transcriptional repressor for pyruvate dehydrogenase complex
MSFNIDTRTVTLVDKVESSILDYIKKNELRPGNSLPNEIELTMELGISRNVLREALSRLRMLGIIESRTKRGIIIQEPSLLTGFEKAVEPYLLSENTIIEMMGMRIIIELGLIDFLFENLTAENVNELEIIVLSQESSLYPLTVEQEIEFHKKIYEITGNNFMIQFQRIIQPVLEIANRDYQSSFAPVNERLLKEGRMVTHKDLLTCIKDKNMEGYRSAIKLHLRPYLEFVNSKS